jgi:hypothetical protein
VSTDARALVVWLVTLRVSHKEHRNALGAWGAPVMKSLRLQDTLTEHRAESSKVRAGDVHMFDAIFLACSIIPLSHTQPAPMRLCGEEIQTISTRMLVLRLLHVLLIQGEFEDFRDLLPYRSVPDRPHPAIAHENSSGAIYWLLCCPIHASRRWRSECGHAWTAASSMYRVFRSAFTGHHR